MDLLLSPVSLISLSLSLFVKIVSRFIYLWRSASRCVPACIRRSRRRLLRSQADFICVRAGVGLD